MNNYGIDYSKLEPGIYLQRGRAMKALDLVTSDGGDWLRNALGLNIAVDDDTLASREAWTFTALSRRIEMLQAVPYAWLQGESEMDVAPYGMQMRSLLAEIDKALQIKQHGAFLHKIRGAEVIKVVWLDPDTITPDMDTASHMDGVTRFERVNDNGKPEWIPAEDLLWFKRPGMRELQSDPAPLEASRLNAEVLYNIAQMEDFFYQGNGLPLMLVMVPPGTSDVEKERMESVFQRIYNRMPGARQVKTIAVREGVTVQQLSLTPNDMDIPATKDENRKGVLSVHHVPESIAMSNAANFATALSDQIQFAGTMATRMEAIAEVFNNDVDFEGFTFEVMRDQMPVNQEEETQRANAVSLLVASGETLVNAYGILGYDLPKGYVAPEETPEPEPQPVAEPEIVPPAKSQLWHDDAGQFKRWIKKRTGASLSDFRSNELSREDKAAIAYEVAIGQDAPFPGDGNGDGGRNGVCASDTGAMERDTQGRNNIDSESDQTPYP